MPQFLAIAMLLRRAMRWTTGIFGETVTCVPSKFVAKEDKNAARWRVRCGKLDQKRREGGKAGRLEG
jgi:hypothetical protein